VHLTKHVLPTIETFEAADQSGRYINAYLWDFYNHGQDKPISEANGIPRGQVWYLFMEFSMVLDAIVTGVKEVMVKDLRIHDDDMGSTAGESVAAGTIQDDWATELEKDEAVVSTSARTQGGPMEKERGEEAEATAVIASADPELTRPDYVSMRDWNVYDVFYQLQQDFNKKFKAMWA
jgi:ATP-dependent RNA helicase DDX60